VLLVLRPCRVLLSQQSPHISYTVSTVQYYCTVVLIVHNMVTDVRLSSPPAVLGTGRGTRLCCTVLVDAGLAINAPVQLSAGLVPQQHPISSQR